MNYAKIRKFDTANGYGIRTTLFVSGCTHRCEACFNKEQQNFKYGNEFTKEVEDEFIELSKNKNIIGINILGGEPLQQDASLKNLLERLRKEVGKNIWLWSGYTFEEILQDKNKLEVIKLVDVLIDGKFEKDKKDLRLKYRGSYNQRVIDIQETLKTGTITIFNE